MVHIHIRKNENYHWDCDLTNEVEVAGLLFALELFLEQYPQERYMVTMDGDQIDDYETFYCDWALEEEPDDLYLNGRLNTSYCSINLGSDRRYYLRNSEFHTGIITLCKLLNITYSE